VVTPERRPPRKGGGLGDQWSGVPLALVPEAQGGVGLARPRRSLMRRAAYHAARAPSETMIAGALWARPPGGDRGTLAPTTGTPADRRGRGYILRKRARALGKRSATLVFARAAGSGYLVLCRGLRADALRNLANEPRERGLSVALPAQAVRAGLVRAWVTGGGALIRAQQMVGAMERCLDHALRYAMERKQFGRPIGKFQAVQMMLAEAAGHYAAATAAADLAAEAYGTAQLGFAVAVAKSRVGEAAGKVAEVCHQVHGAMGFTQEHPLHFATRRLWSWRDEFGHESFWQERIGRMVCAQGGEALCDAYRRR
jgi:acyl-CoA dehydrogenase